MLFIYFFLFTAFINPVSAQVKTPIKTQPLPQPEPIMNRALEVNRTLNHYSVIHSQNERFEKKIGPHFKMHVKYSNQRVYLKILEGPNKNAELLYNPIVHPGKVKVHKGSFPDITLNLSPHNSLLMKHQHHPIEHMGFHQISSLLKTNIQRSKANQEGKMTYLQETQINQRPSHLIELLSSKRETLETMRLDEDIWSFANRLESDPFLILHTNQISDFNDIPEGAELRVPTYYAVRTLLYIDKETSVFNKIETYDLLDQLYEKYEWTNLDLKTPLTDADFDAKNGLYSF